MFRAKLVGRPLRDGLISAVALGVAFVVVIPTSAQAVASTPVVSQGEGRILTVSLLNSALDPLVGLPGGEAINFDGSGDVVNDTPLNASLLAGLNLQTAGVNLFGNNGIIRLGAVGQYAAAYDNSSSVAFSGTVSQASSLVGAGTTVTGSNVGTPGAADSATISVNTAQILGGANLVSLNIGIGALAASAAQSAIPTSGATPAPTGQYVIAGLTADVGGDALTGAIGTINALILPTLTLVNSLIATDIVNPFATGHVSISLNQLLAAAGVASINDLPPSTDLLQYLPQAVATQLTATTNALLASLQSAVSGLGLAGVGAAGLLAAARPLVVVALSGLPGVLAAAFAPAVAALLQLTVNNQTTNVNGSFTQNALTVGVGTTGNLARVSIANATVGPNVGVVGVSVANPESILVSAAILLLIAATIGLVIIRRRRGALETVGASV